MPKLNKEGKNKPAASAPKRVGAAQSATAKKKRDVGNVANPQNGSEQRVTSQDDQQEVIVGGSSRNISTIDRAVSQGISSASSIQADIDFTVAQIQRQSDWLASATSEVRDVEVIKARLDILTTAWGKFEEKCRELQQRSRSELQRADDMTRQQQVEDVYVGVRAQFCNRIKSLQPAVSTAAYQHTNSRSLQLQFAELPLADRLPVFGGAHREWIQFRDIFTAEVIQNPHLTNLQRLRRLQSCVKDSAARAMGYWPQREESFSDAWKTLCLAFDNEYLCHAAHCSAIYGLPIWPKATHALMRNMLDVTRNSLRMISRQLGAEEQRDLLILNFLESRLDSTSRSQWEMVRPTDRIPNLQTDFYVWLERRSSGLLSQATLPSSNHSERQVNKASTNQRAFPSVSSRSSTHPCFHCSGDHAFHRCPGIGSMHREEKVKRIFELGLCQNCLRRGHTARNCLQSRCPRCARAPHNSIICPKLSGTSKEVPSRTSALATAGEGETVAEQ
ncbi:PREDICTED: uncharacterized protein LOC108367188 [Rhagoletis zephyria]|uniref:uncharacterized protein LOC108367188 n=1 Tax=Rhagoletis zephyria TaxID=28612 RepID=UPI0008117763|nr:PREDICTED: uncharacterized protein LOC108367188 [Rhagoletis zephyria]